jgi:BirA family transcriptional regulator, biotin operon repressor / biotin---[acetyl-CoA-carboxylase] ligase
MAFPEGVDRLILDEIDSTNEEARRRAHEGAVGPVWIMARRQHAGRGRRGAVWRAPEGNLNATLLLRPRMSPAQAALLSFVGCLAVAELLDACAPRAAVAVKWPNDALLDGGKVAGVLLESEGRSGALDWLAVGIGVNLAHRPELPEGERGAFPPVSLRAAGVIPPSPEEALELLAAAFHRRLARFEAEGFAPIRAEWLSRAARLGETVVARLPRETVTGVFAEIDAEGALVLDAPSGRRAIAAAEVHFP